MEIIYAGLAIVGFLGIILLMFLTILWAGFKMGRRSIDKPLAPIFAPKATPMMEQDPWYKPMHGVDQPSYPTGADR